MSKEKMGYTHTEIIDRGGHSFFVENISKIRKLKM